MVRGHGEGPSHTEAWRQTRDSRCPGTCYTCVPNSTPSQGFPDLHDPTGQWALHLGLDERPTWPRCCQVLGGPASRSRSRRHGQRQSRWPSSGGLSWPKRDRYNSVLEDKQNKLVNFSRLQNELRSWETPQCVCSIENPAV